MRTEMHGKHSLLQGRPHGDWIASKGCADAKVPVVKRNPALVLDFAHDIAGAVFNPWQNLRKGSGADLVASRRDRHPQRLVRPLVVINLTPLVKPGLHLGKIAKHRPG